MATRPPSWWGVLKLSRVMGGSLPRDEVAWEAAIFATMLASTSAAMVRRSWLPAVPSRGCESRRFKFNFSSAGLPASSGDCSPFLLGTFMYSTSLLLLLKLLNPPSESSLERSSFLRLLPYPDPDPILISPDPSLVIVLLKKLLVAAGCSFFGESGLWGFSGSRSTPLTRVALRSRLALVCLRFHTRRPMTRSTPNTNMQINAIIRRLTFHPAISSAWLSVGAMTSRSRAVELALSSPVRATARF
mmetsp:Transcript_7177/g.8290  ORF Transcript_7177/g.8290 Transcript_7177/m.8290 type:complete len:245 (+) Transcript_7177:124-858(+)